MLDFFACTRVILFNVALRGKIIIIFDKPRNTICRFLPPISISAKLIVKESRSDYREIQFGFRDKPATVERRIHRVVSTIFQALENTHELTTAVFPDISSGLGITVSLRAHSSSNQIAADVPDGCVFSFSLQTDYVASINNLQIGTNQI